MTFLERLVGYLAGICTIMILGLIGLFLVLVWAGVAVTLALGAWFLMGGRW